MQPSSNTTPSPTEPPACWSPPWSTPGRPSSTTTPSCPRPCWWSPPAGTAAGSTWALRPHRGKSTRRLPRGRDRRRGSAPQRHRRPGHPFHEAAHCLRPRPPVQTPAANPLPHRRYCHPARELGLESRPKIRSAGRSPACPSPRPRYAGQLQERPRPWSCGAAWRPPAPPPAAPATCSPVPSAAGGGSGLPLNPGRRPILVAPARNPSSPTTLDTKSLFHKGL